MAERNTVFDLSISNLSTKKSNTIAQVYDILMSKFETVQPKLMEENKIREDV